MRPSHDLHHAARMLATVHQLRASGHFPIKEDDLKRRNRLNRGFGSVVTLSARGLKLAWDKANTEPLVHTPARLTALQELLLSGIPIDDYPKVLIGQTGGLSVADGRHRIALAAKLDQMLDVAVEPNTELWIEFLVQQAMNVDAVPSRAAWRQCQAALRRNFGIVEKDSQGLLSHYFPAPV